MFQPKGQQQLLRFALDVFLRRQEQVFGHLLGNGAAALYIAAGKGYYQCACGAADINAAVFVKAGVFNRNKGFLQVLRHFVKTYGNAAFFGCGGVDKFAFIVKILRSSIRAQRIFNIYRRQQTGKAPESSACQHD